MGDPNFPEYDTAHVAVGWKGVPWKHAGVYLRLVL